MTISFLSQLLQGDWYHSNLKYWEIMGDKNYMLKMFIAELCIIGGR